MTCDPIVLTQTVRLGAPLPDCAVAVLGGRAGILGVLATRRQKVRVTYDLRRICYEDIVTLITQAGVPPSGGFGLSLRRGWARFVESNLLAQAKVVHRCCNEPPRNL